MDKNHVPDWKLERYLLGELPSEELDAIRGLEERGGELRERIAALKGSNADILAKYPPAWMARKAKLALADKQGAGEAAVSSGGASVARGRGGMPRWALPAFACVALLLAIPVIRPPASDNPAVAAAYEDRIKGSAGGLPSPGLEIWRKVAGGAEKLAPESAAQTGDIVQLRYIVPESCYGALLSVDGRGVMTVHLSGDDGKAMPLTPGRPIALDMSYQLDDAPKFEAFYLITAPDKFELEPVKTTLMGADHPIGSGEGLPLPEKQVTAFTLKKFDGKGIN